MRSYQQGYQNLRSYIPIGKSLRVTSKPPGWCCSNVNWFWNLLCDRIIKLHFIYFAKDLKKYSVDFKLTGSVFANQQGLPSSLYIIWLLIQSRKGKRNSFRQCFIWSRQTSKAPIFPILGERHWNYDKVIFKPVELVLLLVSIIFGHREQEVGVHISTEINKLIFTYLFKYYSVIENKCSHIQWNTCFIQSGPILYLLIF